MAFGKELLTRLIVCSLCIMSICNLSYEGHTLIPETWPINKSSSKQTIKN